jgi:hypothetical protein
MSPLLSRGGINDLPLRSPPIFSEAVPRREAVRPRQADHADGGISAKLAEDPVISVCHVADPQPAPPSCRGVEAERQPQGSPLDLGAFWP